MIYDAYKNKGLTGLANLGNTCYINSSLQVLSHIPELSQYSSEFLKTHETTAKNGYLLKEWVDLYNLMWNKNSIISPNRFLKVIQTVSKDNNNSHFVGFDQNDSTEFFYFIIQIFHSTLKQAPDTDSLLKYQMSHHAKDKSFCSFLNSRHKDDYSFIDALFSTYIKIEFIDKKTNKTLSVNYENFYILDIALPQLTVVECLDHHFSPEELNAENDNQYYDDTEGVYKDVIKRSTIYNSPLYMIVQLKRWNLNLKKNQRVIQYDPQGISMKKYHHPKSIDKSNSDYELFGIINHSGNVFGGHYYSYMKGFNGKWYEFNDTAVKEIQITKLHSNKNYCFIYRRNK